MASKSSVALSAAYNETLRELIVFQATADLLSLAIAIFKTDADGQLVYSFANKKYIEFFGIEMSARKLRGKRHYDIFPEIKERNDWLDDHERLLAGQSLSSDGADCFNDRHFSWRIFPVTVCGSVIAYAFEIKPVEGD